MTGILITGGDKPPGDTLKKIIQEDWLIVAADSGLEWAVKAGIEVSYCVGDMDSIKDESVFDGMEEEQVFRYPRNKDDTDTEIGVRMLKEKGCGRIIIWGAGGGRMDHFLAVFSLFDREEPPDEWYTEWEHMIRIDSSFSMKIDKGKRISLFPLGTKKCRMKSRGLEWPLDELEWKKGDFGISNTATGEDFQIKMESGRLLMIYDIDEDGRP